MKFYSIYLSCVCYVVLFPLSVIAVDSFIPAMVQLKIYCFFTTIADDDELANNALATTSLIISFFLNLVFVFILIRSWRYLLRDKCVE